MRVCQPDMEFSTACTYFESINSESGDARKMEHIAELFTECISESNFRSTESYSVDTETVEPGDMSLLARYVQGEIFAGWDKRKVGVGPAAAKNILTVVSDKSERDIDSLMNTHGDVGLVGEFVCQDQIGQTGLQTFDSESVSIQDVHRTFGNLTEISGSGSRKRKQDEIVSVMQDMSGVESKYFLKLLLGNMRIGVGGGTVRDAIAELDDSITSDDVEQAVQLTNDYGYVATLVGSSLACGDVPYETISTIKMQIGRPVQSMKAQQGGIEIAFGERETVWVDMKLDGARSQIHYHGGGPETVEIYSSDMENVTESLPEVREQISNVCNEPVILDGEVIAIKEQTEATSDGVGSYTRSIDPLPFNDVLRRFRRENDIGEIKSDVPVTFIAFDILMRGDEPLYNKYLTERVSELHDVFGEYSVPYVLTDDIEVANELRDEALSLGHEGVMVKDPQSSFTPGKRQRSWMKDKAKRETLDVVVIGGRWGDGKRSDTIGAYHIAVQNDNGELSGIGFVGTGVTESDIAELNEVMEEHTISTNGDYVKINPSSAGIVLEVSFDEIFETVETECGYSLRFPSVESIRTDKDIGGINTIQQLQEM